VTSDVHIVACRAEEPERELGNVPAVMPSAAPPAGAVRPAEWTEVILEPTSHDLTLDELLARCLGPLSERLSAICSWGPNGGTDWKIGDFNFLVLQVWPREDVCFYVQWWSEPLEAVVAEVCSGHANPSARPHIKRAARQAIRRRGYELGGPARNFRKEVLLRTRREVEAAAREALALFHDVFGYRGQTPLQAHLYRGDRAPSCPVHHGLTPEDTAKLLGACGYSSEMRIAPDGERGIVACNEDTGDRFVARLHWPVPDAENLFAALNLLAMLEEHSHASPATINAVNGGLRFGKVYRDDDGDLMAAMDLRIDGGVTAEWIARSLNDWHAVRAEILKRLREVREAAEAPVRVKGPRGGRARAAGEPPSGKAAVH